MESSEKLTSKEFAQMIKLLNQYVTTEMDQWELWSFDTKFSRIYINISMQSQGSEEAYTNLNSILESANDELK